ncbi:hypothetical protein PHLCEN_2v6780 [Hermanssonia centrifuga]|uniref:Uncharacterized protein n=1 Tax=Hermanssonia centrifuga TaxID=98765 RepID=A0A2R6NYF7_9APHY|nr:hypothetical protein PHLCEN_2v6780 [Hermanssonia centrifuga]
MDETTSTVPSPSVLRLDDTDATAEDRQRLHIIIFRSDPSRNEFPISALPMPPVWRRDSIRLSTYCSGPDGTTTVGGTIVGRYVASESQWMRSLGKLVVLALREEDTLLAHRLLASAVGEENGMLSLSLVETGDYAGSRFSKPLWPQTVPRVSDPSHQINCTKGMFCCLNSLFTAIFLVLAIAPITV